MKKYKYEITLFISSVLYGSAYAFMPLIAGYLQPFSANALKSFFAVLILLPFVFRNKLNFNKNLLKGSFMLSLTLWSANYLLQLVSDHMSAGKSGFISTLYVVLVPIMATVFFKKKQSIKVWISILVTTLGLYLLFDLGTGNTFTIYDIVILLVPVIFAIEIFAISKYTKLVPPVHMSAIALVFVFIYNLMFALFSETATLENIISAIPLAILLGGGCLGMAILLQTISQKYLNDVLASVIMSLESVVSAVTGFIVLHQILSVRELMGCLIMFIGTLLCEIFTNQNK